MFIYYTILHIIIGIISYHGATTPPHIKYIHHHTKTNQNTHFDTVYLSPHITTEQQIIAERCSGFTGAYAQISNTTTSLPLPPMQHDLDAPQPLVDRKPSVSLLRWNSGSSNNHHNNITANANTTTTTVIQQQNNRSSIRSNQNDYSYIPMTETNRNNNNNYTTNTMMGSSSLGLAGLAATGAARQGLVNDLQSVPPPLLLSTALPPPNQLFLLWNVVLLSTELN